MRFRGWWRSRPRNQSVGSGRPERHVPAAVQLRAVVPPGAANRPDPVLYNGRYTGSELPERVKAPLPPGASVIDDSVATFLKKQGLAP